MVDFALTEEQQQLRALAHEFAEKEIAPKAAHHDQTGEFPREICRKAWELGLMNTHVPEAYGGPGLGVLDGCMIAEEIAWGCTGIGTAMEANTLAEAPVIVGGSDEQKRRFLAPMTKEFRLAAYCVTEPQAGSDVQGIKTVARKEGDDYVLKGSKMWITNGSVADWYVVVAYTDPSQRYKGMSAFVVPRVPSSMTRSIAASSGETPRIFATSASVLPVSGLSFSLLNPTSKTFSEPPASIIRFSHESLGVRISLITRARVAGSRSRLRHSS